MPPKAIAAVLTAADPVISFLAVFISVVSVQDEPSQSSVVVVAGGPPPAAIAAVVVPPDA